MDVEPGQSHVAGASSAESADPATREVARDSSDGDDVVGQERDSPSAEGTGKQAAGQAAGQDSASKDSAGEDSGGQDSGDKGGGGKRKRDDSKAAQHCGSSIHVSGKSARAQTGFRRGRARHAAN